MAILLAVKYIRAIIAGGEGGGETSCERNAQQVFSQLLPRLRKTSNRLEAKRSKVSPTLVTILTRLNDENVSG